MSDPERPDPSARPAGLRRAEPPDGAGPSAADAPRPTAAGPRRVDPEEFLRHADRLRAFARRLVADDGRADDVVQEALVAAAGRSPDHAAPVGPWLVGVVRNVARKLVRSETRRARHEAAAAVPGATPRPDELAARAEAFRDAIAAVHELHPVYRDVVVLHDLDGLSMPAVAARLGVPVETVRTRHRRALALLRERLDRRHGERDAWALVLCPPGAASAPGTPAPGTGSGAAAPAGTGAGGGLVGGGALVTKTLAAVAVVVALVAGGLLLAAGPGDGGAVTPPATPGEGADRVGASGTRTGRAALPADAPPEPIACESRDGRFDVTDAEPGTYRMVVRPGRSFHPDFSWDGDGGTRLDATLDVEVPASGTREVSVTARPGGRLRIAALDREGGLVGARCEVRAPSGDLVRSSIAARHGTRGACPMYEGGVLDRDDVSEVVEALAPGRYRVTVTDDDAGDEATAEVVLDAGRTATLELRLERADGARRPRAVDVAPATPR